MKIQRKLLLSYLLIVGLFLALGIFLTVNIVHMSDLQNQVKHNVDINSNAYIYQQGMDEKRFASFVYSQGNTQLGEQMLVSSADTMQPAEDFLLSALANDPELFNKFTAVTNIDKNQINNALVEIIAISNGNDPNKFSLVNQQLGILMASMDEIAVKLADFRSITLENSQKATTESQSYANTSIMSAIIASVTISIIAIVLAVVLGKRMTDPLKKLTDIAGKVSMGELDQKIDIKTGDEINDLAEAFQRMINAFKMTTALSNETLETDEQ